MALLYRAIWQDDLTEGVSHCHAAFVAWISHHRRWAEPAQASCDLTGRIAASFTVSSGKNRTCQVSINASEPNMFARQDTELSYFHGQAVETVTDPHEQWTTTVQAWSTANGVTWFWVDVDAVGGTHLQSITPGAPAIVAELLTHGAHPHVSDTPLTVGQVPLLAGAAAGELVTTVLNSPKRTLPVILVNDNDVARRQASTHRWSLSDIAQSIQRRTTAIAATYRLDDQAAATLTRTLGQDYGIWGGAIRTYLPDLGQSGTTDPDRHRYFLPDRYLTDRNHASALAFSTVAPLSTLQAPDGSYEKIRQFLFTHLQRPATKPSQTPPARPKADNATSTADWQRRVDELTALTGELADDLWLAQTERAEATTQLAARDRHILDLQAQLDSPDTFTEGAQQDRPVQCTSSTEAAQFAQQWLSEFLILPDTALVDLADLDTAVTSMAWGQTAWEGFQALAAYAADRKAGWTGGGFWEWCLHSGNPLAWRATSKKLSMKESDPVMTSQKLRAKRTFAVPPEYSSTRTLTMQAHLKVAEGGGHLAPRIMFEPDPRRIDDPETPVYKVIVGYFGPHKHLPNSKT